MKFDNFSIRSDQNSKRTKQLVDALGHELLDKLVSVKTSKSISWSYFQWALYHHKSILKSPHILMRHYIVIQLRRVNKSFRQSLTIKNSNQQVSLQWHQTMPSRFSCPSFHSFPTLLVQQLVCVFPNSFVEQPVSVVFYGNFKLSRVYNFTESLVSQSKSRKSCYCLCSRSVGIGRESVRIFPLLRQVQLFRK